MIRRIRLASGLVMLAYVVMHLINHALGLVSIGAMGWALTQAGFDTGRPAAWAAEGLLGFLPPDAQDRLLDNITALSAEGSQLVAEVFLNTGVNQSALDGASGRWQENGLDVALDNLGFSGERNDAATYLQDRGWQPVCTPLNQLLADNGLPLQPDGDDAPFAKNYYCTAVLHKAG